MLAGLAAVVFAVVWALQVGWRSASTFVTGAVGLALLALFLVLRARRREPLMRLGIFKAPNLAAANVAQFMLGAAWIPMFFVNLHLQQVIGLGGLRRRRGASTADRHDHGRGWLVSPRD